MKKYRRRRNISEGDVIRMLSVERISELYDFHPNTVRSWVNSDGLRHIRRGQGGKIYIGKEDVERHIKLWYE
ncbi:helix-turn-helix domain-containing protein [Chloroflexota bacterium]